MVVLAIVLYAEHGPVSWMPSVRWWGLGGATAVTFGYPVRWYRRMWKVREFWLVFAGLLLAHLIAYVVVLRAVDRWPLLLFALITPGEWMLICPLLERAGRRAHG